MSELRKGRLAKEEWGYIRENIYKRSPKEMAELLHRDESAIVKYINDNGLVSPFLVGNMDEYDNTLRLLLHHRSYWNELKKQLTDDELEFFEVNWIELMKQFNEDVLPSEELQLKDHIVLEILKNRSLADRKKHLDEVEKLESIREALLNKVKVLKKNKNVDAEKIAEMVDKISMLTEQILNVRAAATSYTAEHTKFLEKGASIAKDLKTLRSDRIKRVEDGKEVFMGYVRMLEDERKRREEGAEIEIMREAKEKERERLSKYHTFVDGTIDRPFLTPETVLEHGDEYE